jgi:low temperature requirement protein LtrA
MLELFFDLVFVFVITQVTTLVGGSRGWEGYGQAALILTLTWYLYNGFAWLTNNVAPTTLGTRLPLFFAMTCFMAMAVVVPDAFGSGAWVFGVSYAVLVVIHAVQFSRSSLGQSASAIRRVVPVNLSLAALLLLAAAVGPTWGWVAWCAAVVVIFVGASLRIGGEGPRQFSLRAHHFAERHHLLVVIALGETIIQVGQGAASRLTEWPVAGTFVAGLMLISALWWVYFGSGDDTRGAEAFAAVEPHQRGGLGARAYTTSHLVHIVGLVLCAAGLRAAIRQPVQPLGVTLAVTMSAGVALFLVGQGASRRALAIGSAWPHGVAAAVALVVSAVGVVAPAMALVGALAVLLLVLSAWLARRGSPEVGGR